MAVALHGQGFGYIVFLSERVDDVIFMDFIFGDWKKMNISVKIKTSCFVFCGR